MEDIVINGISINQLKEQKKAIQQGAARIISDSLEAGKAAVEKLLGAESQEDADKFAAEALAHYETAQIVEGVSDVGFEIPYYEEYGGYESDEIASMQIENSDNEFVTFKYSGKDNISKLMSLLTSMESDSRGWNSSMC